ncbi:MAG: membrane protein insertion efficiency factor YidD [Verrucomicrobia bacterium]|nr:membrane protein insertion efficiency factor YidD [Verrucomicrobiota bacterium]MBI3869886.1 membrane protein insertion efficiency factor YidD [Verrucomicrobiota bacterium]
MSESDKTSRSLPQACLCGMIHGYQRLLSPLLCAVFGPSGLGCRYTPTCSAYMHDAVRLHGAGKGVVLGIARLCRCHPWGGAGHDPVPPPASAECRNNPATP